jgi:hypothetical protein
MKWRQNVKQPKNIVPGNVIDKKRMQIYYVGQVCQQPRRNVGGEAKLACSPSIYIVRLMMSLTGFCGWWCH